MKGSGIEGGCQTASAAGGTAGMASMLTSAEGVTEKLFALAVNEPERGPISAE